MIKTFEMFAGYGGASFALKKAGIHFECVGYSEIDKFATKCYDQNHRTRYKPGCCSGYAVERKIFNTPKNYGDATKINPHELPDFDLLTGGFPCQAFSVAGKGLGEQDTRGTLFNDIIRIAEVKKPKYMLLENVKGLLSKKHKATFRKIIEELSRIGYVVNWYLANSKEHGIPQNRERVFFVCWRFGAGCKFNDFEFPKTEELKIFLKDILEDEVDEKYYLKEDKIKQLIVNIKEKGKWNVNPSANGMRGNINKDNIAKTLTASDYKEAQKIIQLNNPIHSNNRVYSDKGISPTLNTMQGGDRQPFVQIKNATKKGYLEAKEGDGVNLEQPNSKTRRGRVQKGLSSTLQCNDARGVIDEDMRIRKLTPTECFRLMGFLDDEIRLEGLSNTQRYKLAGNGWDINLVSKIFKEMFNHETR